MDARATARPATTSARGRPAERAAAQFADSKFVDPRAQAETRSPQPAKMMTEALPLAIEKPRHRQAGCPAHSPMT